ncbi:MAG: hypothetical protein V1738_06770 [Patescibacteria group bacterium]|jgi:hypothetical protein|nr:hypothetical protein [bacterium]
MDILKSASKVVFVLMALATIGALFLGKISGDQFLLLAGMAFSFYFSNKGDTTQPFAGK